MFINTFCISDEIRPWSGIAYYTGVTTNKNMLGYLLLVLGLLFLCTVFSASSRPAEKTGRRTDVAIGLLFLDGLLIRPPTARLPGSRSMSSEVVMALDPPGGVTLCRGASSIAVFFSCNSFDIWTCPRERGRNATLTGRTEIWATVLVGQNPLVGTGFRASGSANGPRRCGQRSLFRRTSTTVSEIYLNLGLIGLLMFVGCSSRSPCDALAVVHRAIAAVQPTD